MADNDLLTSPQWRGAAEYQHKQNFHTRQQPKLDIVNSLASYLIPWHACLRGVSAFTDPWEQVLSILHLTGYRYVKDYQQRKYRQLPLQLLFRILDP